jgi:hypothetical protein
MSSKQMSGVNPMKVDNSKKSGEYEALAVQQSGRPSTIPSKISSVKEYLIQSLFGGKNKA